VRRGLRLLRSLALPPLLAALRACLPDALGAARGARASLPCAAFGEHAARRLLCCTRLCASLRGPLARAAADASALLAQSYFMPLALTALALCGRAAALLRALQADAAGAYNALAPLLPSLPPPAAPPQPGTPPLPALLRCDWGDGGAPDALAAIGELALAAAAPAQALHAPAAATQPHSDDVGAAVPRGGDDLGCERVAQPLPDWLPLSAGGGAAGAAAPPPAAPQQALVFMDRGCGAAVPIVDEADDASAGALLVSAERPRYALLSQSAVLDGTQAPALQPAPARKRPRGSGAPGPQPGRGRGRGAGGGGDALAMLLGGTGMDAWS
jgi:hypothetical protein